MKEEARKTKDVEITEDVSFRDMMLSEHLIAGLTKCNFKKPSPIQLRAIPIGRCGLGGKEKTSEKYSTHKTIEIILNLIVFFNVK